MEALNSNPLSVVLANVPRFSQGTIRKIPQYVFENCNQVTCNHYSPEYLSLLKEKAKTITKDELRKLCKDEEKFVRKGEEFDWIYALDSLEKEFLEVKEREEFLDEILKVETLMRYNGYFSRFSNDAPGEFRKRDIEWPRSDFGYAVDFAAPILNGLFEEKFGKNPNQYLNTSSNKKVECLAKPSLIKTKIRLAHDYVSRNVLKGNVDLYTSEGQYFLENYDKFDIEKCVDEWVKEQNRKDGKIEILTWCKSRFHYFPLSQQVPGELENSINEIKKAKQMHVIEKACKLWFEIVRIHISNEAHKRTGKGLGSIILLAFGYPAPKIGKEDEKEYMEAIWEGLNNSEKGHLPLTFFVAKNLTKTYQEFFKSIEKV